MINTMGINKAGQRERKFGDEMGVKERAVRGGGRFQWYNLLHELYRKTKSLNYSPHGQNGTILILTLGI